jgi:hypothetical protein
METTGGLNMETMYLGKSIVGIKLIPQDQQNHPLFTRLIGGDEKIYTFRDQYDFGPIVDEIKSVAKSQGISVSFCGNIKSEKTVVGPTVRMWEKKPRHDPCPLMVFDGVRQGAYDMAHRESSDLYPEAYDALSAAIKSGNAFDTGWYSNKHELDVARICRKYKNGPICVDVRYICDVCNNDEVLFDDVAGEAGDRLHWKTGVGKVLDCLDRLASEAERNWSDIAAELKHTE